MTETTVSVSGAALCSVPGKAEDCGTGKAVPACVNNIKKQSHYLLCGKIINIFAKK